MRIALATCQPLPEPDPDQAILLEALARDGAEPAMCAWTDADVDWAAFDLCVLRSTWDYYKARDAFLGWLEKVQSLTRVQNTLEIARWNSHKSYLVDVARQGFRVAPTRFLPVGSSVQLADLMCEHGWSDVVVKPAVSASSYETHRIAESDALAGQRHLSRLLRRGDVLVQQYLRSIHGHGERAVVFVDGGFTHAVRKRPRYHGEDESVEGPIDLEPDELELAQSLMQKHGRGTLYGRVDLARTVEGHACLMELELIEPSLFLVQHPPALERFVAAILRTARR